MILFPDDKRKPREPEIKGVPFVGEMITADSSQSPVELSRFYDWANELASARGSYNEQKAIREDAIKLKDKAGRTAAEKEMKGIQERFPMVTDIEYKRITTVMKRLSNLNKKIDEIVKSNLSDEEKRKRIKVIDRERWGIAVRLQEKYKF